MEEIILDSRVVVYIVNFQTKIQLNLLFVRFF